MDQPVRMIDIEFINVLGIRIGNIELCGRTIRYAYFPECRAVSGRLINKIAHLNFTICISCMSLQSMITLHFSTV